MLASGIRDVRGRFHAGDPIAVLDRAGAEVARGVSSFSSSELARIQGMNGRQIAQALGRAGPDEVVHRDHLVLTQELDG